MTWQAPADIVVQRVFSTYCLLHPSHVAAPEMEGNQHAVRLKALGPEGPSFRFGGQGFPAFTPSGGSAGKTVAVPGPEGPGLATAGNQIDKPAILRPLGGIEKLFWLISQNRQTHFAITAEVAGSSQVAQWQEALDRICGQLPVIWSRIVPDSRGAALFEVVPRGSIPLQVVEDAGLDWATHVAAQIERPFDPSEAPLLRATLLHGDDRSVIILCAHHTIADGLSLSFLMRDLLRTLGGETVVLSPVTASLEQMVASRAEPAGALTSPSEAPPAGRDAPYRLLDGSLPHVESLRCSREKTERLRAWARAERTTVHGALSAAATFAASVRMPGWSDLPLRIHSPIDLRGRLACVNEPWPTLLTNVGPLWFQ